MSIAGWSTRALAPSGQQRFHFPPQGRVAAASRRNKSSPGFRPVLQCLMVDLLDAPPFFLTKSSLCHIFPSDRSNEFTPTR
jgi:hypothetical protein